MVMSLSQVDHWMNAHFSLHCADRSPYTALTVFAFDHCLFNANLHWAADAEGTLPFYSNTTGTPSRAV
jgi:hypothetical protein